MGEKEYFILLVLMFMNLVMTAFFTTATRPLYAFHFVILAFLILSDLAFIFMKEKRMYAILFFIISLANMAVLFIRRPDFAIAIVAVIDLLVLYYINMFVERDVFGGRAAAQVTTYGEETLKAPHDEELFTSLGYPTLSEIAKDEGPSMIVEEELPVHEKGATPLQVVNIPSERVQIVEETKKKGVGYVHINALNLPDPVRKDIPDGDYSYELYYEDPTKTLEFRPIEEIEERIERQYRLNRAVPRRIVRLRKVKRVLRGRAPKPKKKALKKRR